MTTLVLLPGLLCDKALWQAQEAALKATHQLYIPTLDRHDQIPALAAEILAEIAGPFALAGLSMGGYVALEIMRQAPDRITRLALFDSSARPDTPEQKEKREGLIRLSRMGKFKGVTPRLLPQLIHPDHLADKAITDVVLNMGARIGQSGFVLQQTAIMGRIDSRPHLSAIRCPALIAVGAEDQLTPPDIAREIHTLIPQSKLEIIPHCGHLAPLEQPAATTKLLQDWLSA